MARPSSFTSIANSSTYASPRAQSHTFDSFVPYGTKDRLHRSYRSLLSWWVRANLFQFSRAEANRKEPQKLFAPILGADVYNKEECMCEREDDVILTIVVVSNGG